MKFITTAYLQVRKWLKKMGYDFLVLRYPRDFEQDGLSTSRLRPFDNDPSFIRVRNLVSKELGSDYEIDWRTHVFLWAVQASLPRTGLLVELGTGKGWMIRFAEAYFGVKLEGHEIFLFDRFDPRRIDNLTGIPREGLDDYYADSSVSLREKFADLKNLHIVEGDLPGTLDSLKDQPIKFVHVDLNAAEPEVQSLERIWNQLVPGAIVLLDDFTQPAFHESNSAMTRFAHGKGVAILWLPTGQGLILVP